MQILECPHCATRVANDGSLTGLVVTCPGCMQQFQMPAAAAVEAVPMAPNSSPMEEASKGSPASDLPSEESVLPRKRRERRRGPSLWVAALGSTAVFWLVVFIVLWASGFSLFDR